MTNMLSRPDRKNFRHSGLWKLIATLVNRYIMQLKTKFIIFVAAVVILSFSIIFFRISCFQQRLVFDQAVIQARMLHQQIRLTGKWVADHNGLFILKKEGVEPNPFLQDAEIRDSSGHWLVKRNSAMVIRELSVYAAEEGFCRYGITSLHPINPANIPDEFEKKGLERFRQGAGEAIAVEEHEGHKELRYIAPLPVEEPCLKCHGQHGYKIGDICGGLSVAVPMDRAYEAINHNNRLLLMIGIITLCLLSLVIFLFFDGLVGRRLARLSRAMDNFSDEKEDGFTDGLPAGNDEVGRLAKSFSNLCQRLIYSRQDLAHTRDQVIYEEKQDALDRLVAGLGHEINTPLTAMLNCLKTMEGSPEDLNLRQRHLKLLTKGLNRIEYIVHQLMTFGRREGLHPQPVAVDELIRECCETPDRGIKNIDLHLDLNLPHHYPLDKEALKQVVMNISLNAVQSMPDGGVLTVSSRREDKWLIIEFQDTGMGISPENMDKIFEPFFTTRGGGQGTGLGLSVVYTLVRRMGGTLEVQSKEGRGSSFKIKLPMNKDNRLKTILNAEFRISKNRKYDE